LRVERANAVPQEQAGLRVEVVGGLIEKEHVGRVHERARDHEALRHAAGVAGHAVVLAVAQAQFVEEGVGALLALAVRHAVIGGVEGEDLAHAQAAVEVALLRDHGDALLDADGVAGHVEPMMAAEPEVGSTLVMSTPMVVVLPAPLGPSRPKISPGRTLNVTPSTALTLAFGVALHQVADFYGRGVVGHGVL
jgi:hypothetical protein